MISMQLAYTVSLAIVASSVSILVWVWFWTRKQELNNKSAIFVFVGGAIAFILALPFQKALDILIPGTTPITVLLWASVEEILKLFIVLCAIKFFRVDRLRVVIYMIIAALGFAALENVLFIVRPLFGENITGGVATGNLRFIGASLMHVVASSVVGVALATSFDKSWKKQAIIVGLGLILAVVLHSIFNIVIFHESDYGILSSFSIIWILGLVLVYIIFRKGRKIPKKEVGIFVLIIILSISGAVYMDEKLPKYTPEVLSSWQAQLKRRDDDRASYFDTGPNFTESLKALDSIRSQLRQIVKTMEENRSLSSDQLDFLSSYNVYVDQYICILRKQEAGNSIENCKF